MLWYIQALLDQVQPSHAIDYSVNLFFPGAQIDDKAGVRSATRVSNPPGGRSTALW